MSEAPVAPVTANGAPPTQEKTEEVPTFKVFAGNLAYSTTDEGLKAFFEPVSNDVVTASVILRGSRSTGYGFVALKTAEAAENAVNTLNGKPLDGRDVLVQIAKPTEQKVQDNKDKKAKKRTNTASRRAGKAVPGEVSEAEANGEVKTDVAATAGTDEAAKPKKKKKKAARKAKAAKAEGEEAEATAAPVEGAADAEKKAPRARKPKTVRPPRPAGEDPDGEPSKTMLFVANLGFNIDDAGLSALFTDAGIKVVSARIVRRRWGQPRKSKGYGFVDVGDEAEQKKAIGALEGKDVGGRAIAVKVAVNTPHDEDAEAPVDGAAPAVAPAVAATPAAPTAA